MNTGNYTHGNSAFDQHKIFSVEEAKKIVEILNSLVQINNDRIEGYGNAVEETEDTDLKALFNRMISKSRMLNISLINEVRKYGGEPTESTSSLGKAFRVWMDFKATLTGKNHKAILESCKFGEEVAQETYGDALKESVHLPAHLVEMITEQTTQLREDLNYVKSLIER